MLNLIVEKENIIYKKARDAKREQRDIYIWRCGEMGKCIFHNLQKIDVQITGFCVDSEYYKPNCVVEGVPVLDIAEISARGDEPLIIVAFRDYDSLMGGQI